MINVEQKNTHIVRRKSERVPTKNFLYPGTKETLKAILANKHTVVGWTNAFFEDFISSRLGSLRRDLPPEEKKRFSVLIATSEYDKHAHLPTLFELVKHSSFSAVTIIDNKIENLEEAARMIKDVDMQKNISSSLIWINNIQEANKPDFYNVSDGISFVSLHALSELQLLPQVTNTLFLVDFDDTILDTEKWEESLQQAGQSRFFL